MAVKRILISEAHAGMELANDLYDDTGRLIVPYGTILSKSIIRKIENYNIVVIKVIEKDELNDMFNNDKDYQSSGYYENLRATKEFASFENTFNASVNKLKNSLNDIVIKNAEVDVESMLRGVHEIVSSNKTKFSMLDVLNCMRGYDDLTYVHSMNVALICNMIAGWLNLTDSETDILTTAGLLHDIGKVRIPYEIISKPTKLTNKEYSIVKLHPQLGYEILKDKDLDTRIKYGALMHHERFDGTGYPNHLSGEKISIFGRIIAIADVYDAMTANRVYREGLCPFDVIDYFEKGINIYDPRYLLMFLQKTAETYISNSVLLNNGKEGKIALINKQALGKPVVMVDKKPVDLSKERDIKIVKML